MRYEVWGMRFLMQIPGSSSWLQPFLNFCSHCKLCGSPYSNQFFTICVKTVKLPFREVFWGEEKTQPVRCLPCFLVCNGNLCLKIRGRLGTSAFLRIGSDTRPRRAKENDFSIIRLPELSFTSYLIPHTLMAAAQNTSKASSIHQQFDQRELLQRWGMRYEVWGS